MARKKASAAVSSSKPHTRSRVATEAQEPEVDISLEESSPTHTLECINSYLEASMAMEDEGDTIYNNTRFRVLKAKHRYYHYYHEQDIIVERGV